MPNSTDTTRDDASRLLRRSSLFAGMDEAALRLMAGHAHRRRFASGEVIFRVGSPGQSMMAVLAGMVRITAPSTDGKEIVLADLGSGEVFGEMALLDGGERSADAAALTNCDLLVLERRDMLTVLERHPGVAIKLLQVLCERLRRTDQQISEIAFLGLPMRLAKALLRVGGGAPQAKLALSQRELGTMIGGTRESVNRCLREWHRRGVIQLEEGWIIIRDAAALEEIGRGNAKEA
ncbi:MAG: Crp/Fnr family transcriptional regulator [Stellaceae bacterium]